MKKLNKAKILGYAFITPPIIVGLYYLFWILAYSPGEDLPLFYYPAALQVLGLLMFGAGLWLLAVEEKNK